MDNIKDVVHVVQTTFEKNKSIFPLHCISTFLIYYALRLQWTSFFPSLVKFLKIPGHQKIKRIKVCFKAATAVNPRDFLKIIYFMAHKLSESARSV